MKPPRRGLGSRGSRRGHGRMLRLYIGSSGAALVLVGLAKLWSAWNGGAILSFADPVLLLPFRSLFVAVGVIEIGIGCYCLVSGNERVRLGLLAWLATCFAIYRVGLMWIGFHVCRCFGTIPDTFHLSPAVANGIAAGLFAYLLAGSWYGIYRAWMRRRES